MNDVQGQGQVAGNSTGTIPASPEAASQNTNAAAPPISQSSAPATSNEEAFFDPSGLNPELMPAYKRMQSDYTRKMQEIARHKKDADAYRQKATAYDQFMADPVSNIRRLAQQYNLSLAAVNNGGSENKDWQPQTWDEVLTKAAERAKTEARQEVLDELRPVLSGYQRLQKENIETRLDKIATDWRDYESEMASLLQDHPTLATNPEALYRLAVPPEKMESAAYTKALEHMQRKKESAQLAGSSTTNKKAGDTPPQKMNFRQAAEWAQRELASKGIRLPA